MKYLLLIFFISAIGYSQEKEIQLVDITDEIWDTLSQEKKNYYWDKAKKYIIKYGVNSQYNKLSYFEDDKTTIPPKAEKKKCKPDELCYYTDNPKWVLTNSSSSRIGGVNYQMRMYQMKFSNGDIIIHTLTLEDGKIIDKATAKSF